MSCSFSRILDPAFEDMDDPFKHYNHRGEPIEDRLYLPCGIDPDKKEVGVAFLHPFPQNNLVLEKRKLKNVDADAANWLIARGKALASDLKATPIYVFEATNELWLPLRRYLHAQGGATATVSAFQTHHARQTKVRKSKNDLIDAMNIAKVFKAGESHATRMPHSTIRCLREYCRTHFFFVQFLVACANRMHAVKFQIFPEFDTHFAKSTGATPLALMQAELVLPENICATPIEELAQVLHIVSRGRFGQEKAEALQQSAHTTFATEYADEAHSFCLKVLAEVYQHIQKVTLKALKAKIQECLKQLPFEHQLATIPYFGEMVIGTFLAELGDYRWFLTVDAAVAWFGLDPSVSSSANHPTAQSHITKRGSKIGRRMMWLTARNFAEHTTTGKAYLKQLRSLGVSYDAAMCKIAAKLVRVAFSMLKSGKAYDEHIAFQQTA
jgi:transposase